jgi:hypothetical protein
VRGQVVAQLADAHVSHVYILAHSRYT